MSGKLPALRFLKYWREENIHVSAVRKYLAGSGGSINILSAKSVHAPIGLPRTKFSTPLTTTNAAPAVAEKHQPHQGCSTEINAGEEL